VIARASMDEELIFLLQVSLKQRRISKELMENLIDMLIFNSIVNYEDHIIPSVITDLPL